MSEMDFEGVLKAIEGDILDVASAGHTYKCTWEDNDGPRYGDQDDGCNPYFACTCGAEKLEAAQIKETIQFALRLAERMQSGDVSPEMAEEGREAMKQSFDYVDSIFKAMSQQLMKEVSDE
jgi:hypothetical protein